MTLRVTLQNAMINKKKILKILKTVFEKNGRKSSSYFFKPVFNHIFAKGTL